MVSNGAGTSIVPDVIGQPKDTAVSILKSRGLSVQVVEQDTDEPERGRARPRPGAGERNAGRAAATW